jgi:hypothetical protein
LSALHIVRDLRRPPAAVVAASRVRDGSFDVGIFEAHWAKAAAALNASKATVGSVATGVNAVGERFQARRAALEAGLQADKAALEAFLASSRHAAEHLAQQARRGRRELGQFD